MVKACSLNYQLGHAESLKSSEFYIVRMFDSAFSFAFLFKLSVDFRFCICDCDY